MKFSIPIVLLLLLATNTYGQKLVDDICNINTFDTSAQVSQRSTLNKNVYFERVSTFHVCKVENVCPDTETVAEIVDVTPDGMTAIYTDSASKKVGFVDIKDPSNPTGIGVTDVDGEPTSVSVSGVYAYVAVKGKDSTFTNPTGNLKVIDVGTRKIFKMIDLGGQPDSVATSPDGKYVAVAIENERDEDLGEGGLPQLPAGFLVIIETDSWKQFKVELTGLAGVVEPTDPEPEFVSINEDNIAVVTLQENNGIVLVDCATKAVINSFSAGSVSMKDVDTENNKFSDFTGTLTDVPREPDGITWIDNNNFVTANEGDWNGGSRGFTIFNKDGTVVYESGNLLEHIVAQAGHHIEKRSGKKGNEPENVAFGKFTSNPAAAQDLLFVNSERSSLIMVFDAKEKKYIQTLPSMLGPEGSVAVPARDLFIAATEVHVGGFSFGSLGIYTRTSHYPKYPSLVSKCKNGVPIPWAALSGLGYFKKHLYSIEDSAFEKTRIFEIDPSTYPRQIVNEIRIMDSKDVFANSKLTSEGTNTIDNEFSAADLKAMINDDKTVNIDGEGIHASADGFWIVSEGKGTVGDADNPIKSLNLLFKTNLDGVIEKVVTLPKELNAKQLKYGFEGVTMDDKGCVVVAFQRAWGDEAQVRIGFYDPSKDKWGFVFYPIDESTSGWVGLSDISYAGNNKFLILERDNQFDISAKIKKIYEIDVSNIGVFAATPTNTTKTLKKDLLPVLQENNVIYEKIEGLTIDDDGNVWINNDNDAVDDNSGENLLMTVPDLKVSLTVSTASPTTSPTDKKTSNSILHSHMLTSVLFVATVLVQFLN